MTEDAKPVSKDLPVKNIISFWDDKLEFDKHLMNPSTVYLIKCTVKCLKELEELKKKVGG